MSDEAYDYLSKIKDILEAAKDELSEEDFGALQDAVLNEVQ